MNKPTMKLNLIWSNAKSCLKNFYWKAFGVSLLYLLVTGVANGIFTKLSSLIVKGVFGVDNVTVGVGDYLGLDIPDIMLNVDTWQASLLTLIFTAVLTIFLTWILNAGLLKFFSASREREDDVETLFSVFKNYGGALKVSAMYTARYYLWWAIGLPFTVAGYATSATAPELSRAFTSLGGLGSGLGVLIASLLMFCVPYIYAENPSLEPKRIFELSKQMTEGYKLNIFGIQILMGLFMVLGAICCVVGMFFAMPLVLSVYAEMYAFMKDIAKANGITNDSELPGYSEPQPSPETTAAVYEQNTAIADESKTDGE